MVDALGWFSSLVLIATLARQNWKQWHDRTSEGVSRWLFTGQTVASLGFIAYSWLLGNWVFVVTNFLLLINGFVGVCIVRANRMRAVSEATATCHG